MKLYLIVFAIAGLIVTTRLPATAQLPVSDTMTIFQNATPGSTLSAPESEGPGGFTGIFISVEPTQTPTGNPALFGSYTVLTEPDGTISDVFGVMNTGTFSIAFFSAGDVGLTSVPSGFINPTGAGTPITLAEGNGGPFDATTYLNPVLVAQGYTATFQSDAERVPEPSALMLLGLGGAGLVGHALRRRRQAASVA